MRNAHLDLSRFVSTFFLILFMYITSVSLTFYNKWMTKKFHFPLTVSMIHFVVVFIIASIIRKVYEAHYKQKRVVLDWSTYIKKCFPTAVSGSLDIGLSNWSIMLSTVSLYTMAKSSTIIFIVGFSLLFGLEKLDRYLCAAVVLIFIGLCLFTLEDQQFSFYGFCMGVAASLMGGVRWTTSELIMQKKSLGLHNPFDAIYHIQPVMAISMVFLAFSMEGPQLATSELFFRASSLKVALSSFLVILVGATLAFLLIVSEYLIVSNMSSITLSIASIFKEICVLTIAAEFGGDKWTMFNFIGLVICMCGISLHIVSKLLKDPAYSVVKSDESAIALTSLITEAQSEDEETFN
ncbi:solute carrier family 35 member C2 isoform X2 [Hydra vulgaris]|uniref:solute carrier family 35 member C2 isoform X2 n=1 Tax=Hydra vulgaris TaxID=6087 RepID=UPI001F5EF589|nr:solute carrier family 35 member C2 isoform X2 [Hydra vulgaris]